MNTTVITYATYLVVSICLTVWVGHTLHKNGRIFLVDAFARNAPLADSVNHLLLVGFYLVNLGFVSLFLKAEVKPPHGDYGAVFEVLSGKVGVVLLVLGGMHFMNLYGFARLRRRTLRGSDPPPVEPEGEVGVPA